MKSEFEQWRDELEPPRRRSIAERLAGWAERQAPAPDPVAAVDHFIWRRVADVLPIEGERL